MTNLEERIKLSAATLDFINKQNTKLEKKIAATNNKKELQKLLKEVKMWGEKCDRESVIIENLKKEAAHQ